MAKNNNTVITLENDLSAPTPEKSSISGAGRLEEVRDNHDMISLSLSLPQAARVLGVSTDTIQQLCNKRLLRSFHIGRRHLVSLEAIKTYIREQEEAE